MTESIPNLITTNEVLNKMRPPISNTIHMYILIQITESKSVDNLIYRKTYKIYDLVYFFASSYVKKNESRIYNNRNMEQGNWMPVAYEQFILNGYELLNICSAIISHDGIYYQCTGNRVSGRNTCENHVCHDLKVFKLFKLLQQNAEIFKNCTKMNGFPGNDGAMSVFRSHIQIDPNYTSIPQKRKAEPDTESNKRSKINSDIAFKVPAHPSTSRSATHLPVFGDFTKLAPSDNISVFRAQAPATSAPKLAPSSEVIEINPPEEAITAHRPRKDRRNNGRGSHISAVKSAPEIIHVSKNDTAPKSPPKISANPAPNPRRKLIFVPKVNAAPKSPPKISANPAPNPRRKLIFVPKVITSPATKSSPRTADSE